MINQSVVAEWLWAKRWAATLAAFSIFTVVLVIASPAAVGAANVPSAGDAEHGKQLFDRRCGGCHSLDQDKEGPRLRNAYGRKAGTVANFSYSDGLKSAGFSWDASLLDKWLTSTDALVPDNDMEFSVPNPAERADIIEYLKVVSGK